MAVSYSDSLLEGLYMYINRSLYVYIKFKLNRDFMLSKIKIFKFLWREVLFRGLDSFIDTCLR